MEETVNITLSEEVKTKRHERREKVGVIAKGR